MSIRMMIKQSVLVLSLVLALPTWSQDLVQVKAQGSHKYSSFKKTYIFATYGKATNVIEFIR